MIRYRPRLFSNIKVCVNVEIQQTTAGIVRPTIQDSRLRGQREGIRGLTILGFLVTSYGHQCAIDNSKFLDSNGAEQHMSQSTDTCGGIEPEKIQLLFEPFLVPQADDKVTGLNLAIAKEIISTHGGNISANSEPGLGTTIIVTLPVEQVR